MRFPTRPFVTALSLALVAAPAIVASPPAAFAQQQPADQQGELKQIAITDKQVQGFIAAKKEIDALVEKAPEAASDKPDPKIVAQLDAAAKKYGFANYAEYDDVSNNIGLVMEGVDPQTKKYVGAETMLKKELAGLQADKKMPAKDKKDAIEQITAALKSPTPLRFAGNADIVVKNYDKLIAAMPPEQ